MAHRSDSTHKRPLSSFSLRELLAAGFALAIAGPLAFGALLGLLWLTGEPAPRLGLDNGPIPIDIVALTKLVMAAAMALNAAGAVVIAAFLALWRMRAPR